MAIKDMTKMYETLKKDLGKLAGKVGHEGKVVFGWYVKNQKLEGYLHIGIAFVFAAISVWGFIWLFQSYQSFEMIDGIKVSKDMPGNVCCEKIAGFVMIFVGLSGIYQNVSNGVREILNPEYWAFSDFISDIRG